MQIEKLPVDRLIPYARNSRTHDDAQVAQIASSIREFGFTNPILIDEKDSIIAGHGRVMAARKLSMVEVPCIRLAHLTDAQKRAYVIADNKLALNAGWDDEMLKLELADLKAENFDLSLTGFSAEEIAGLTVAEPEKPDADADAQTDKAEELREKWGVELGQVWQLGEHRIVCGDCTQPDVVAKLLGEEKPHLMVTDPPYGVNYDAGWRIESGLGGGDYAAGVVLNDDRADWSEAWGLFPGEVAYVWHAMLHAGRVFQSLVDIEFIVRAEIVWAKSQLVISRGHYHPQHESCFYAVRKGGVGHWSGDRKQTTLWQIEKPKKSETGHSTQKPVECMERPIRNSSKPGDLVYEPFSGSGTTIIACERTARKCRAIELNPAYVAVAIQRWHDATGKDPRKL